MNNNQKKLLPLISVLILFPITRFIYDQIGIKFQGDTYLSHWQFIDVNLLYHDLWRSVFYLHSQPPLLNLFTGIVLQIFPAAHEHIFNFIFYIAGLLLVIALYFLGNYIGLNPWTSCVLCILFIASPSAILYENWLSYSFMLAMLITLSGVFLYKFFETQKTFWGFLFFLMLTGLTLTWSLFHIFWLYTFTFLIFILLRRNFKKVLLAAFVPILITTGWYIKNSFLYGEFTSNSWAGMNLANITTFRLSEKERIRLQKSGNLSKMATIYPFRNPVVYLKIFPNTPLTGVPVLDQPYPNQINHHHLVYIEASRYYLHDALTVIRLHPYTYLKSVWQSIYIYFHSTSDFDFLYGNKEKMENFDLWWNRFFYGQWGINESMENRMTSKSIINVSWFTVIAFLFSITWCAVHLYKNITELNKAQNVLILFMLYNILFISIIGNMAEIGENNRFRFVIDPFLMITFAFSLKESINLFKKSRAEK